MAGGAFAAVESDFPRLIGLLGDIANSNTLTVKGEAIGYLSRDVM